MPGITVLRRYIIYVAAPVIKMMRRPLACAVTSPTSAQIGSDAALRDAFAFVNLVPRRRVMQQKKALEMKVEAK